jgi:hypothetical protein
LFSSTHGYAVAEGPSAAALASSFTFTTLASEFAARNAEASNNLK